MIDNQWLFPQYWITYFSIIIKKLFSLYIIKWVLAYGGK
ncbi:hypothetical protein FLA_4151 [Filimonas lacunae]|nr:hypothetical protein FLA_4151 [Filimonas lacunae]